MECSGGRVGRACPFKRLQRLKARALELFAIAGKMKAEAAAVAGFFRRFSLKGGRQQQHKTEKRERGSLA